MTDDGSARDAQTEAPPKSTRQKRTERLSLWFGTKTEHPTEVEGPFLDYPSSVPQLTGPSSGHSTSLGRFGEDPPWCRRAKSGKRAETPGSPESSAACPSPCRSPVGSGEVTARRAESPTEVEPEVPKEAVDISMGGLWLDAYIDHT